jgi:simple sugar transport system permease protein
MMGYTVELRYRDDVPGWLTWGSPVLTILAALIVGLFVLIPIGADPVDIYTRMFVDPLTSRTGIVNVLTEMVPLLLVGLAVYLPLKAGLWNIGGDGQFYLGAIAATWIGLSIDASSVVLLPVMILGAAVAGGLWAFIPGYLRAKWNVNDIIVTLLMTFIGIQLNEYLIRGPLQGTSGYPASSDLPAAAQLPSVSDVLPVGLNIHLGVLVALALLVGMYVLMNRMAFGFQVTFVGSNPDAARQSGISTFRIIVYTMVIGGVLAGVAGVLELSGVQPKLQSGISPGYGFTAIPIALLGQNGPFRVLLASLFFAVLSVGANVVSVTTTVNTSIIEIIQALVILFLITTAFFQRFEASIEREVA